MKKYLVSIPYCVWVSVEVEADSKEDAIDAAYEDGHVGGYAGNGGTGKLIGVTGENVSISTPDDSLDGVCGFECEVEEI